MISRILVFVLSTSALRHGTCSIFVWAEDLYFAGIPNKGTDQAGNLT